MLSKEQCYQLVDNNTDIIVDRHASELIQDGFNLIYQIQGQNDRYILRVSNEIKVIATSQEDYIFEMELLEFLNNQHMQVPKPLKWKNGSYILEYTDDSSTRYFCCLFVYVEGTYPELDDEVIHFNIGALLADLHREMGKFQSNLRRYEWDQHRIVDIPLLNFQNQLGDQMPQELHRLIEIGNWMTTELDRLEKLEDKLPKSLVHGDFHNINMHLQANGTCTILDFDFTGKCYLAFDIACFIGTEKVLLGETSKILTAAQRQFIAGYQSKRQLLEEEIRALPVLEASRWMILIGAWTQFITLRGDHIQDGQSTQEVLKERISMIIPRLEKIQKKLENGDLWYYQELL